MPKPTLTERVTILETDYHLTVENIKKDLGEIKTNVGSISVQMPELLRKVNEHHAELKVIKPRTDEHERLFTKLESAGCPNIKVLPDDLNKRNGDNGKNKRKTDGKMYKLALYTFILTCLAFMASNLYTCSKVAEVVGRAGQEISHPK